VTRLWKFLVGQLGTTRDAAILSMDVTVTRQVSITVSYLLASNEYDETPRSTDVFGAFREGTNVAWIDGNKAATTDTLDCNVGVCGNGQLNPLGLSGYSSTKEFTFNLSPGLQKLKLAIADGGSNNEVISAVFLSFKSVLAPTSSPTMKPTSSPAKLSMKGMGMGAMKMMM
jgi:hypothetical protein